MKILKHLWSFLFFLFSVKAFDFWPLVNAAGIVTIVGLCSWNIAREPGPYFASFQEPESTALPPIYTAHLLPSVTIVEPPQPTPTAQPPQPTCTAINDPSLHPDFGFESFYSGPHPDSYNICIPEPSYYEQTSKNLQYNALSAVLDFVRRCCMSFGNLQGKKYLHEWWLVGALLLIGCGVWHQRNLLARSARGLDVKGAWQRTWPAFINVMTACCYLAGDWSCVLGHCLKTAVITSLPYFCTACRWCCEFVKARFEDARLSTIGISQWIADLYGPHLIILCECKARSVKLSDEDRARIHSHDWQLEQQGHKLEAYRRGYNIDHEALVFDYNSLQASVNLLKTENEVVLHDAHSNSSIAKQAQEDLGKIISRYQERDEKEYAKIVKLVAETALQQELSKLKNNHEQLARDIESQSQQTERLSQQPTRDDVDQQVNKQVQRMQDRFDRNIKDVSEKFERQLQTQSKAADRRVDGVKPALDVNQQVQRMQDQFDKKIRDASEKFERRLQEQSEAADKRESSLKADLKAMKRQLNHRPKKEDGDFKRVKDTEDHMTPATSQNDVNKDMQAIRQQLSTMATAQNLMWLMSFVGDFSAAMGFDWVQWTADQAASQAQNNAEASGLGLEQSQQGTVTQHATAGNVVSVQHQIVNAPDEAAGSSHDPIPYDPSSPMLPDTIVSKASAADQFVPSQDGVSQLKNTPVSHLGTTTPGSVSSSSSKHKAAPTSVASSTGNVKPTATTTAQKTAPPSAAALAETAKIEQPLSEGPNRAFHFGTSQQPTVQLPASFSESGKNQAPVFQPPVKLESESRTTTTASVLPSKVRNTKAVQFKPQLAGHVGSRGGSAGQAGKRKGKVASSRPQGIAHSTASRSPLPPPVSPKQTESSLEALENTQPLQSASQRFPPKQDAWTAFISPPTPAVFDHTTVHTSADPSTTVVQPQNQEVAPSQQSPPEASVTTETESAQDTVAITINEDHVWARAVFNSRFTDGQYKRMGLPGNVGKSLLTAFVNSAVGQHPNLSWSHLTKPQLIEVLESPQCQAELRDRNLDITTSGTDGQAIALHNITDHWRRQHASNIEAVHIGYVLGENEPVALFSQMDVEKSNDTSRIIVWVYKHPDKDLWRGIKPHPSNEVDNEKADESSAVSVNDSSTTDPAPTAPSGSLSASDTGASTAPPTAPTAPVHTQSHSSHAQSRHALQSIEHTSRAAKDGAQIAHTSGLGLPPPPIEDVVMEQAPPQPDKSVALRQLPLPPFTFSSLQPIQNQIAPQEHSWRSYAQSTLGHAGGRINPQARRLDEELEAREPGLHQDVQHPAEGQAQSMVEPQNTEMTETMRNQQDQFTDPMHGVEADQGLQRQAQAAVQQRQSQEQEHLPWVDAQPQQAEAVQVANRSADMQQQPLIYEPGKQQVDTNERLQQRMSAVEDQQAQGSLVSAEEESGKEADARLAFAEAFPLRATAVATEGSGIQRALHALIGSMAYQQPAMPRPPTVLQFQLCVQEAAERDQTEIPEEITADHLAEFLNIWTRRKKIKGLCLGVHIPDEDGGRCTIIDPSPNSEQRKVLWIGNDDLEVIDDCDGLRSEYPDCTPPPSQEGKRFFDQKFPCGIEPITIKQTNSSHALEAIRSSVNAQYHEDEFPVPYLEEFDAIHEGMGRMRAASTVYPADLMAVLLNVWGQVYGRWTAPEDRIHLGVWNTTGEIDLYSPDGAGQPKYIVWIHFDPNKKRYAGLRELPARRELPASRELSARPKKAYKSRTSKRTELASMAGPPDVPAPPSTSMPQNIQTGLGPPTGSTNEQRRGQQVAELSTSVRGTSSFAKTPNFAFTGSGSLGTCPKPAAEPTVEEPKPMSIQEYVETKLRAIGEDNDDGSEASEPPEDMADEPPFSPVVSNSQPAAGRQPAIGARSKLIEEGKDSPPSPVSSDIESEASDDPSRGLRTMKSSLAHSNRSLPWAQANTRMQPAPIISLTDPNRPFQIKVPQFGISPPMQPNTPPSAPVQPNLAGQSEHLQQHTSGTQADPDDVVLDDLEKDVEQFEMIN